MTYLIDLLQVELSKNILFCITISCMKCLYNLNEAPISMKKNLSPFKKKN